MTQIRQILDPVFNAFPGVPPWLVALGLAVIGAVLLWLASKLFKWVFVLVAVAVLLVGVAVAFRLAFG